MSLETILHYTCINSASHSAVEVQDVLREASIHCAHPHRASWMLDDVWDDVALLLCHSLALL